MVDLLTIPFEPIQVYELLTFLVALLFLKLKKNTVNQLLFLILFVNIATEMLTTFIHYEEKPRLLFTISVFLHNSFWLFLLSKSIRKSAIFLPLFCCYILFSILNLFFMEGIEKFNFNTFIIGAFLYLVLFIYGSFHELKKENYNFFLANQYLLLFAPVLYFFGLSFVFGFKSRMLTETIIFGDVSLYEFIISFVNIVYYSLVNIYIYREKKMNHGIK